MAVSQFVTQFTPVSRPKYTPLKSNLTNYILSGILQTIIAIFFKDKIETILLKQFFFSTQNTKICLNMCKSLHKMRNAKNLLAVRFRWQNET